MPTEINGETFGLTEEGFSVPRARELMEFYRSEYEAETGLDIDWEHDEVLSTMTAIYGKLLGKLCQIIQELYDARDPEVAQGFMLEALSSLTGITRQPARASEVVLTLTGDSPITVPAGKMVEDDDRNRWKLTEDVELTEDGDDYTGTGTAEATETGPIEAQPGEITEIITPVAGWTEVTNEEPASIGQHRETDSELRTRRRQSLQIQGGSSRAAIRGRLLALDAVASAEVFDNTTNTTKTVAGVEAPPHSVIIYLYGHGDEGKIEATADREAVGRELFDSLASGVQWAPADPEDADDYVTVKTVDGVSTDIRWHYPDEVDVDVEVTVEGVDAAAVEAEIEEIVRDYFAEDLFVGEDVRRLPILGAISGIDDIRAATVRLSRDGDPLEDDDIEIADWELGQIGSVSIA